MRWKGWILNLPDKSSRIKAVPARARKARTDAAGLPDGEKSRSGMTRARHLHPSDFHGISQLTVTAIGHGIDLIQEFHGAVAGPLLRIYPVGAITALVYRTAKSSIGVLHRCLTALLPPHQQEPHHQEPAGPLSTAEREAVLAALNGLVGDHLAASDNPMQIRMRLRTGGRALPLERQALAAAFPGAGGKLLILIHGLCRSDLHWRRKNHDHGAALARDLGYTPLYLHYNSGLHISSNGQEFAALMETLAREWPVPVEEISLIGHSMGGLVARSACYYGRIAGHQWLARLKNIIFLGTPHHGTPLERGGNWLTAVLGSNRYTAPFARLGRIRSAGITDLRYGNLLDRDWHGRDRFEHAGDRRQPVPLPRGVKCCTVAGSLGRRYGDLRERLLGDGIIPLDTALGKHTHGRRTLAFPRSRSWVAYGVHHLDLLSSRDVYARIKDWLA
jgi:pimeloyl-ACP methyl ester carboxylesterase